jgi:hypothetical protein
VLMGEVMVKKLRGWSNEALVANGVVGFGEAVGVVAGDGEVFGVGELLIGCLESGRKVAATAIAATARIKIAIATITLIFLLISLSSSR